MFIDSRLSEYVQYQKGTQNTQVSLESGKNDPTYWLGHAHAASYTLVNRTMKIQQTRGRTPR